MKRALHLFLFFLHNPQKRVLGYTTDKPIIGSQKTSLLNYTRNVKFISFLAFFGISVLGWGQVTVAFNGAESTGTTLSTSSNTFSNSSTNSGTPAERIKNGTNSFQKANGTATFISNAVNISGYTNVFVEIWNASISGTAANGIDSSVDKFEVFVSDTPTFSSTPDILINSLAANTRWGMSGTGIVSTNAGTAVTYSYPSGGTKTGTSAYSKLIINIPSNWTVLYIKVNAVNNDSNEIWCLDDVTVKGSPATTYSMTYDGNTNTGGSAPTDSSSPYASGATVTVLGNTGSLVKTGYSFNGWNTAADGSGTPYIEDDTFTMPSSNVTLYAQWVAIVLPTVTTTTATSITDNSASSGGNVTADGGDTVTARGVVYATSINPTLADNVVTTGSGTGSFTSNLTSLSASTLYYYRAYATNSAGTAYGNEESFTTSNLIITSAQTGNWSETSTWVGGVVPNSSTNAVIASGHVVTLDTTSGGINTRNSGTTTTVNAGGTLATSVQYINNGTTTIDGSFQLNAGGYTNSGNNFVYGANGTLIFNNTSSYGVNNSDQYWPTTSGPYNVTILQGGMTLNSGANRTVAGIFQTAAGVTLNATLNLSGTCQINGGGYFNNAPTYTGTSTLVYNNVTGYGVNNEWTGNSTSAGVGIPQNVTLTNSSVNLPNSNRGLAGSLNIDSGSTLNQNATSGDLYIAGNWANSGTFNANNRAVYFNGSSAQTLTGATTFAWLFLNNSNGLTLNNSAVVNNTLTLTNGKITLGTNDLTINGVSGESSSNYVITNSTGQLKRTVGASNVTFPVGNSAYNPITFNNSGTSDVYGVRIEDGALTTALVNTKTINRKWITTEFVAGGSNLLVVAQYNTGESNTGYDAGTNPYIGFYNGSVWSQVAATLSGSNPYTATSTANSTPSDLTSGTQYFAVGKDNAFESDATHLVFVNVPSNGVTNTNLSTFTVEARRLDDSLDTTYSGSVTITKASGPGTLSGTLTVTAVAGVATFNAVQFDAIGTYTLQATSGSLTPDTSNNILILEVLAAWDFTGVGTSSLPTYAATTFNSGLNNTSGASDITRGANAAWSTGGNSFRTQGFKNEGIATSNTDYFQTTLKVKTGFEMSLYSINANFAGTASYCVSPGVSNQFAFSLDGTNFTLIGSPSIIIGTPGTLPQIDISGISALQNLPANTTVTFRYYASGQTATGGWGLYSASSGSNGLAFSGKMICIQPTAYTVSGGGALCDDASTTIDLSDSEIGMNYQLKKDGVDEGTPVAGTGAALSFTGINQAGTYTIVATNSNGSCNLSTDMTGNAVITITPDTSIITHPITQEVCVGESVTFTVVAANSSAYTYQWKRNGVNVGTDSDTFTIATTVAGDAGNYTVDVLGDCGAIVTSNVATLSFTPQIITWANLETPSNGTNVIVMGQDYTIQSQVYIHCVTDGSGDDSTLKVWLGYNISDSDPSGWTNWVEVTTPATDLGNNYRYSLSTRDLLPSVSSGTFYIAARYQYDNGAFVYGGYSSGGGGIWDDTNYFNGKLVVQPISLYGDATTSIEMDMYSTDGDLFSLTTTLVTGWAKFKQNHDWAINWGSNTFPNGTGTQGGDNIPVTAGTYLVTFNKLSGIYSFTNIECTSSITTTWNGSAWSDGDPDMTKKATFDADYNTSSGSVSACECQINANKTVTVADDTYFTVARKITNDGTIIVKNQGNVIQYTDENNDGSGSYQVEKQLSAATAYDYVYVSSPVSNEKVGGTGSAFENNPNYKWKYDTTKFLDVASGTYVGGIQIVPGSDGYDDNGNDWTRLLDNTNTVMDEGIGYIVMVDGPDTFNPANIGTPVASQLVTFNDGVFNNGLVSIPVQYDLFPGIDLTLKNNNLNFIGNPYPSAISADRFLVANPGISTPLYFWTHKTPVSGTTPGPDAYNFTNADFATYTLTGGVASANGGAVPTGNIASCQGFMVGVTDLMLTNFTFNNLMRLAVNNNNFYKSNAVEIEKDRIWLKLTKDEDLYRQILVAFLPEATLGDDNLYDGVRMFDATTSDFYSFANDKRYAIQALPSFDESYQLPLGMQLIQDGTYQIGLDNFEGIFTQGQAIYLEDTYENVIHDLGLGAYTFTQTAGTNINDRFVLRFNNSALSNEETALSQVKVYPNPSTGVFHISYSGSEKLIYTVYDLTGKKVVTGTGNLIDLSQLNSGIYTAQISNEVGVRSVKLVRE